MFIFLSPLVASIQATSAFFLVKLTKIFYRANILPYIYIIYTSNKLSFFFEIENIYPPFGR
nr:MAG TPA: hypothetical protein [Caudoviricetes sp.]